jgi:hypothetical protein
MEQAIITIDLSYLYSLTGGDKSFEQILLTGTVADVNSMIVALEKSWVEKNVVGIRKNAHSLVSLAAIAGMPQVENWSRTIDQSCADGIFHPELAPLVDLIISGWPSAYSRLKMVIDNN